MHEAFWNEWKWTKEMRSTDDRLRLLLDQVAAVSSCVMDIGPGQSFCFLSLFYHCAVSVTFGNSHAMLQQTNFRIPFSSARRRLASQRMEGRCIYFVQSDLVAPWFVPFDQILKAASTVDQFADCIKSRLSSLLFFHGAQSHLASQWHARKLCEFPSVIC